MSMAWTVIGTASRLAQDAGLHRASSYSDPRWSATDSYNRKWVFWCLYAFDHCLSLSFGRPPNVQDYDISVECPDLDHVEEGRSQQLSMWISLARVEGKIYTELYSARAQRLPIDVRVATAHALAQELNDLEKRSTPFYEMLGSEDYAKGAENAARVVLISCLTMVYKAVPQSGKNLNGPMQFSDECVSAARRAIRTLVQCWNGINFKDTEAWRIYIHWTLIGW